MDRRRKNNRLTEFDYSNDALYFVTSCIQDKLCCLGEIINDEIHLNKYGSIAEKQWTWLEKHYPYVHLHAFVIMPNHMHGIIEIDKKCIEAEGKSAIVTDIPMKIKSLSQLMGAYKTTTSKQIHLAGLSDFAWQRSFYDHIIRDSQAFEKISNYIENNPRSWSDDRFYK